MKQQTPSIHHSVNFDIDDFIAWILEHHHQIEKKLSWLNLPPPIEYREPRHSDLFHLTGNEIANAIGKFPLHSRKRSIFLNIHAMPPTWVAKGSTPSHLMLCHARHLAISEMAIVAAITDQVREYSGKKTQDILLFRIPEVTGNIAKHIQLQAFVREYARTLISPIEHSKEEYVLDISNGKHHYFSEAHMFLFEFAKAASKHSPISHASELYWPLPGPSRRNFYQSIGKELGESVAAYLLGFVYCNDEKRRWDPFYDRPEIRKIVEDFLNARTVKTKNK